MRDQLFYYQSLDLSIEAAYLNLPLIACLSYQHIYSKIGRTIRGDENVLHDALRRAGKGPHRRESNAWPPRVALLRPRLSSFVNSLMTERYLSVLGRIFLERFTF